jgi:hypothetical protein
MTFRVTPEVFLSRVEVRGPDECWHYRGPGVRIASGHIRIAWLGGKQYSHRVAYFLEHGVWPLWCLHSCDRPSCVNPRHLRSGTPQDNVADREARNRRTPRLPRRPDHWSCKLVQRDLDELYECRSMGVRVSVCASEYQISPSTVRAIWRTATAEMAA